MDAGSLSSSKRAQSRSRRRLPLRAFVPRNPPSREYGDRFIPNRSAMDFDLAHYLLTQSSKEKEIAASGSPSKGAYRKLLAEALMMNRTRIFSFKNKPPTSIERGFFNGSSPPTTKKLKRSQRCIPQKPERILDAPDIMDDFYLNLLDWGSNNILSIALGDTVYLWDGSDGSTSELVTVEEDEGPVTSVSWAPDGRHIAVGLNCSDVQLWDPGTNRLLRTLRGVHESRVGSMCWNSHVLTTGGMDRKIVNNDVRVRSHIVHTYQGHEQEVCGLKWSSSGMHLASGGNDNLLHVWNLAMASSNRLSQNQWLHRFEDHTSAVKALAWCPFQRNLLASGGGDNDRCIKFWDTQTGTCLKSVHTGSQVCSLLWNSHERELLSSHGFTGNQLTLWKYPSMVRVAELSGHTSRVLFMAQSPDGYTVASAAADESLRFWRVFGDPDEPKHATERGNSGPFANFSFIR